MWLNIFAIVDLNKIRVKQQRLMSASVKQFAPTITGRLDYATVDVYLLKYEILTVSEFDSFRKALQSGSLTNDDLVHKLLAKIFMKPREFYRALREHVNDIKNAHAGNKELFLMLPENFVSIYVLCNLFYLYMCYINNCINSYNT